MLWWTLSVLGRRFLITFDGSYGLCLVLDLIDLAFLALCLKTGIGFKTTSVL